jgi:myosin heavy subunit
MSVLSLNTLFVAYSIEFGISHFAGDVGYSVENFLEKNKDALATGLVKLINSSSITFIHSAESEAERLAGNAGNPNINTPAPSGRIATRMTLSAKFKLDLDNLMTALRSTTPYFIRCIKPNDYQQSDRFDSPLTLNQLKYSGKSTSSCHLRLGTNESPHRTV